MKQTNKSKPKIIAIAATRPTSPPAVDFLAVFMGGFMAGVFAALMWLALS